jgi:large subunit ribosomal protein L9
MKVILNDFIEHLGERGDSVSVKPGFARNYLLPKGLAYPDTPGNRRRFDEEQHQWEEMDTGRRSTAEVLAREMAGTELKFERRASEKDVLFGSVSVADITAELAERGFELDRRRVMLEHPIKEIGNFEVEINIHRDIQLTLPVFVVRPGEQPVRGGEAAKAGEAAEAEVAEVEVAEVEVAAEPEAEAAAE